MDCTVSRGIAYLVNQLKTDTGIKTTEKREFFALYVGSFLSVYQT
ncbi:hypothetical protein CFBP3840_P400045 (plasmid) [Pseudomonas syringae]|uniref:Uncharacterized protein n=1 Tax=Pseudomonas syringae TaxID=317 RepID=A0A2K4X449_PSESX|nr:hypothetical protein CFBP3840_P400045 [Pseudomonas syringae]